MALRYTEAPSLADIEECAAQAFRILPERLRRLARDVVFRVADFPDAETEEEMGLDSPFDILGLYCGIPIGEKASGHTPQDIDMVFLYRRPILDYWCETGEDLMHLIRHVLIHEIGHHFGLSDRDMERIENAD